MLDWGDVGRPVVFICCYLTGHAYDNIAPKLTDQFHVYAFTRRWAHPTIRSPDYSPQRRANDLLEAVTALKIAAADLDR